MISFDFTSKIAEQFDQMAAIVTGDRFFWTNKDGEQRNTQLFTLPLVLDLREGMVRWRFVSERQFESELFAAIITSSLRSLLVNAFKLSPSSCCLVAITMEIFGNLFESWAIFKWDFDDDDKGKLLLIEYDDDEEMMARVLGGFKPGIHAILLQLDETVSLLPSRICDFTQHFVRETERDGDG